MRVCAGCQNRDVRTGELEVVWVVVGGKSFHPACAPVCVTVVYK